MHWLRSFPALAALLSLTSITSKSTTAHALNTDGDNDGDDDGIDIDIRPIADSLMEWVTSTDDGYIDPNIEIRPINEDSDTDSKSVHGYGLFAKEDIPIKTLLFRIPPSLFLDSTEKDAVLTPLVCGTVRNIAHHLSLVDVHDEENDDDSDSDSVSPYAPYMKYLLHTQSPDILPSAWSDDGKELLEQLIRGDDDENDESEPIVLPPDYPTEWLTDDWAQECDGSDDPNEEFAALLVISRSWDDLMIPIYDIMNHDNERVNTAMNNVRGNRGDALSVTSSKVIKKGEQIYTTYNMCVDCAERMASYGTPEILRDYGFVEGYPQTYVFHNIDLSFRVNEVADADAGDDSDNGKKVVLTEWIEGGQHIDEEVVEELREHLSAIGDRKELLLSSREDSEYGDIPDHEWNTLVQFANNMSKALQAAIDSADVEDHECIVEGTCLVTSLNRYEDLVRRKMTAWTETDDSWPTCDVKSLMDQFNEPEDGGTFDLIDEIKSPYQHLSFMMHPETKDTCFDIDNTIQICDSYRPHYHELSVHNAARYLKDMKRVLWVGGGDSMLLHEFLKYPELELAVGLELDQRVARGAFKHFGTQPHFDNDKVEWWFGDATKSLMMLPKDYFGSFDMVVVDLSETVMSLTVTDKLDVVEALTLLLKPDGVFVKNEFYFGHFKEMFPRSVQLHYYDNPVICSQAMVMGSYTLDFMETELTDHGVEGLLIEPFEEVEDHYALYHDYARNHTSREICDVLLEEIEAADSSEQKGSPGILLVVEAEDTSMDLSDAKGLESTLSAALEKEGFTVASTEATVTTAGSIITIMMNEGYVIARAMPEHKYCAFDIHFWTSLDRHESAKDVMVTAVGSKRSSVSDYRIIAGGLFGVPGWQEGEKGRGPQYKDICDQRSQARQVQDDSAKKTDNNLGGVDQNTIDGMVQESISLIESDEDDGIVRVVVLIGSDGKTGSSFGAVNTAENVQFETIYCPSMLDFNEFDAGALEAATACEKYLVSTLNEFIVQDESKFDALIIDSNADKMTASILLKILSARKRKFAKKFLEGNALVISAMYENESDSWRKHFVQLFKNDVFRYDPSWYVEVAVNDDKGAMKLLLANGDGPHFVQRLNKVMNAHELKSGISIEVQVVDGGTFIQQKFPFEPTHHFLPSDYDQSSPLQQWKAQAPLGHQIIFQMEFNSDWNPLSSNNLSFEKVGNNLKTAISKTGFPGLEVSEGTIKEYTGIGDGCVLIATWSGGSIVVLWDGRKHIDVNLFTYEQNTEMANTFESNFRTSKNLVTMLRDEQPRGIGKVVSYFADLEKGGKPHWA